MSACKGCGAPDPHLTGTAEMCGYCDAAAGMRELGLRDHVLWHIACGIWDASWGADFWARQGAYIVLRERGYEMPDLLPFKGDPMPPRRLRVIEGGRA